MPVLDSHVFDMTRAIQLAVAPGFLLTAIGAIINALMGRLGRAVDRRRKLEELLSVFEGETRAAMVRELSVLEKRIKLVFWAMAFAVLSALLVCVLIGTAFLGAFVSLDLSRPVAALFVMAIVALTACLLAFLREVYLNKAVLDRVNESGKIYLSHTRLDDKFTLRICVGQTHTERQHVERAWNLIRKVASQLLA